MKKAKQLKPEKRQPTTFELAQLAAMLKVNAKKWVDSRDAVRRAHELWEDADYFLHDSFEHLAQMARTATPC